MKNDLVSIYIPTYRRPQLLRRAILSVLSQSYKNIEIIVCSDGYDEGTERLVDNIKVEYSDKIIRFISNIPKSGACDSRNLAIEHANGDFIMGLDDDDFLHHEAVRTLVDSWVEGYLFIAPSCFFMSKRFNWLKRAFYLVLDVFRPRLKTISLSDFFYRNTVGNQIFTKTSILKENRFDNQLPALQDFELWFRILRKEPQLEAKKLIDRVQFIDATHGGARISTYSRRLEALDIIEGKYIELNDRSFSILRLAWKLESPYNLTFRETISLIFNGYAVNVTKNLIRKFKV